MSKRKQKRVALREMRKLGYLKHEPQRDARRAFLEEQEAAGALRTTPEELRRLSVREPFYLPELGLSKDPFTLPAPRYQPGPIISTSKR